jgi:hypothetical protein
MRWQVRRRILAGLFCGLLLGGCGSGNKQVDAPVQPVQYPDAGPTTQADGSGAGSTTQPDAGLGEGCDEDAMGVDYCIKNPGTTVGGGTPVARQNPPNYQTCRTF